jgi:hypothetical protein
MTFGCAYNNMAGDFFHAFACWYAVNDGLRRGKDEERKEKFIFPRLHRLKDDSVASLVTTILRSHCDPSVVNIAKTSAKSLRKGANTFLAMHREISHDERIVRGGWAAVNTSDKESYKESNHALSFPPFCALAGWPDPHARNLPMRIPPTMSPADQRNIYRLRDNLFLFSAKQFPSSDIQSFIRPFLDVCTAAAIMYYPDMMAVCGVNNPMVAKMDSVIVDLMITRDKPAASQLLSTWGKAIRDDFRMRNALAQTANDTNLAAVVNRQKEHLEELTRSNQLLVASVQQLLHNQAELSRGIVSLSKRKVASTVEMSDSNKKRSIAEEPRETSNGPVETSSCKPVTNPISLMLHSAKGQETRDDFKKLKLSLVLRDLHYDGQLRRHMEDLASTRYGNLSANNTNKYRNVMKAVQETWTLKQKVLMTSKDADPSAVFATSEEIEKAVLQKIVDLEKGKEGSAIGKAKPFILGLGTRYGNYWSQQTRREGNDKSIASFLSQKVPTRVQATVEAIRNVISPSKK